MNSKIQAFTIHCIATDVMIVVASMGVTSNINDWTKKHNTPRYILDLLFSMINVSMPMVEFGGEAIYA